MRDYITATSALATSPLAKFTVVLAAACIVVAAVILAARQIDRWADKRTATAIRAAFTAEPIDRLIDGDSWAAANGYGPVDELHTFVEPELRQTPIFQALDFQRWEGEVA